MQVNFEPDSQQQYLNLLGYSQSSVKSKVMDAMNKLAVTSTDQQQQQHSDVSQVSCC